MRSCFAEFLFSLISFFILVALNIPTVFGFCRLLPVSTFCSNHSSNSPFPSISKHANSITENGNMIDRDQNTNQMKGKTHSTRLIEKLCNHSTEVSQKLLNCSNQEIQSRSGDSNKNMEFLHSSNEYPPMTHFNNAGSSPPPISVLQTIIQHTIFESLVGGYLAAEQSQKRRSLVYSMIAQLINAKDPMEIALVESATVAWTRIFYSMCDDVKIGKSSKRNCREDVILCCEAEYAANVVAMQKVCNELHATLIVIPSKNGILDTDLFNQILQGKWTYEERHKKSHDRNDQDQNKYLDPERILLVCITHIPTNSGIINPVNEIGELIENFNVKYERKRNRPLYYLVDACQSVGQVHVDVTEMKCHALTATGRKYLRGPRGTGFLYVKKEVADKMIPSHVDHSAAPVVSLPLDKERVQFKYKEGALRFEFWEANVANQLGLGCAVEYAMKKDIRWIEMQCRTLGDELKKQLRNFNDEENEIIYIHHDHDIPLSQCGIVTFFVKGYSTNLIKKAMLEHHFTLSVVPPTSTPFDSSKTMVGNQELLRASLSYFNTKEDIDKFCNTLSKIINK